MRKILLIAAAIAVAASLTAACGKDSGKKAGEAVVTVNGKEITTEDIKKRLGPNAGQMHELLADEAVRKELLEDIIATELILEDARKKGYDKNPELIQKVEDFRNAEMMNIYRNKEIMEKNAVSEAELTDYIKKNEDNIKTEIKASHILVKTEADAKDVLAKLAKGENFAKLAATTSLDTRNNKTGGDLGPINIRDIPAEAAELEKLVLSLKTGESGMLKGRFGFSVIKVVSKKINKDVKIDNELQFRLQDKLAKLKRQQALESAVKDLRSKAKVAIKEDVLKKLSEAPKGAVEKK